METAEEQLRALYNASRDVLDAVENGETDVIGAALQYRRHCIEALASRASSMAEPGERKLAQDILSMDRKIRILLEKRRDAAENDLTQSRRKAAMLPRYLNSQYNLSSGQLLDRSK